MKDSDSQFAHLLGKAVRDVRESEGLSRLKLAMEANIDNSTLERIERGETIPKSNTIYKISRVIPLDLTAIYNMIDENTKHQDSE